MGTRDPELTGVETTLNIPNTDYLEWLKLVQSTCKCGVARKHTKTRLQ
jgi:hypothetical protein